MNNITLEEMLADCIDGLENGRSIEDCLARYPNFIEDLKPMVEMAQTLRHGDAPTLSSSAFTVGRAMVWEAARRKQLSSNTARKQLSSNTARTQLSSSVARTVERRRSQRRDDGRNHAQAPVGAAPLPPLPVTPNPLAEPLLGHSSSPAPSPTPFWARMWNWQGLPRLLRPVAGALVAFCLLVAVVALVRIMQERTEYMAAVPEAEVLRLAGPTHTPTPSAQVMVTLTDPAWAAAETGTPTAVPMGILDPSEAGIPTTTDASPALPARTTAAPPEPIPSTMGNEAQNTTVEHEPGTGDGPAGEAESPVSTQPVEPSPLPTKILAEDDAATKPLTTPTLAATSTPRPTFVPTSTDTPFPPTATPEPIVLPATDDTVTGITTTIEVTSTATVAPTEPITSTVAATAVISSTLATATAPATDTAAPTDTPTDLPTDTPTITPTPSATPTPTDTPTPTQSSGEGWIPPTATLDGPEGSDGSASPVPTETPSPANTEVSASTPTPNLMEPEPEATVEQTTEATADPVGETPGETPAP